MRFIGPLFEILLPVRFFLDDESRVILKDGGNDYINASYIKVDINYYIQADFPDKTEHFIQLSIRYQNLTLIVFRHSYLSLYDL